MIFPHHFGHQLCYLVYFGKRLIKYSPPVLFRCFCGKRSESYNLRNVFFAVLGYDVFNNFFSAFYAKVYIEVGVRDSFFIKESFEYKRIL